MDSDSERSKAPSVGVIFENIVDDDSSKEPPMEEWSSLGLVEECYNPKKLLYEEGNYDPREDDNACSIYIAQSASSVFRHPYYCYPAVLDPGVLKALLKPEEPIVYPDDGQELYLAVCREMKQCPVRIFYRGLLETEIDLKYYGVNPRGVRPMAMALKYNKMVKSVCFTDNFLNDDACYHLGEMLSTNCTLTNLDLSGCRIGPSGLSRILAGMETNRSLKSIDLSGNELGDAGAECIANAVFKGLAIQIINLSHNNINGKGMTPLAAAFETFNKFTHWDLSWNKLFSAGTYNFLVSLAASTKNLQEMDLSWNGLAGTRVAMGIRSILSIPTLKILNLSNNKFTGLAVPFLLANLPKAISLVTFNLSDNPLTPADAVKVLETIYTQDVNVSQVLMDNVVVNTAFVELFNTIKNQKPRIHITYGYVLGVYVIKKPDPRELLLNRADFLCTKSKNPMDIALLLLQLRKNQPEHIAYKDLAYIMKKSGSPLDYELLEEIVNTFPGPKLEKGKSIDMNLLIDYVKRKWPERKLPPTPPPVEEKPKPKKGKKKK